MGASLPGSGSSEHDDPKMVAIEAHQLALAASPERATRDQLGNFSDFEKLFEQLGQPPVMELGNPLPKKKYLPKKRVGNCAAAHNRELLGEEAGNKGSRD